MADQQKLLSKIFGEPRKKIDLSDKQMQTFFDVAASEVPKSPRTISEKIQEIFLGDRQSPDLSDEELLKIRLARNEMFQPKSMSDIKYEDLTPEQKEDIIKYDETAQREAYYKSGFLKNLKGGVTLANGDPVLAKSHYNEQVGDLLPIIKAIKAERNALKTTQDSTKTTNTSIQNKLQTKSGIEYEIEQ